MTGSQKSPPLGLAAVARLTPRETQCMRLAALGRTTAESATELAVTERTVEFHVANAMRKLGAPNKIRAVVIALQERLIDP